MVEKNNTCWSCGQNTMISFEELGHGWQKCSKCGATHQLYPTVSKRIADMDTWLDEDGIRHYHPLGVHD
jgi:transcription elongation factor Elf1